MADPNSTTEYLDEAGLKYYDSKRQLKNREDNDQLYVKQEFKTGSDSEKKVLSDNNLTDELVDLIEGAADADQVTQDIADAKDELEEYVDAKISSTYKPAGSVETIDELPPLIKENLGNVYNVTDAFVTTDEFIEGAGKDYPIGTNVVIVEESTGVYKYDALAGFIDTSRFIIEGSIQPIPNSKIDALFE